MQKEACDMQSIFIILTPTSKVLVALILHNIIA